MNWESLYKRFTSRKFLFALVSAIIVFGNALWDWGLQPEEVWAFLLPILTFIGIEGVADVAERANK